MAEDRAAAGAPPKGGQTVEITEGPAEGTRIAVVPPGLVLGREAPAPANLGGDVQLSRRHARIVPFHGGIVVNDLGSTNGTYVNGTPVTEPTVVRPGDVVELGTSRLTVTGETGAPVGETDARTRLRPVSRPEGAPAPDAPQPSSAPQAPAAGDPPAAPQAPIAAPVLGELADPSAPHDLRPVLRVASGPRPRQEIAVTGPVVLGADAGADSVLAQDPAIEPQHARFSPLGDGRVLVEDLGSSSGTWVGGIRIPAPTIVENGAFIRLGTTTLELVERDRPGENPVLTGLHDVSRLIAVRAPVPREAVLGVFAIALGWALAFNLLVRTIGLEVLDLPKSLETLKLVSLLLETILPVTANTTGFYKAFGRPSDHSLPQYLIPTILVPTVITVINLIRISHHSVLDILITILVIAGPITINATLMLRLRRRVALAAASGSKGAAGQGRATHQ